MDIRKKVEIDLQNGVLSSDFLAGCPSRASHRIYMLQGSGMKSTQELTEDLRSRFLFIPNSGSTMAAWDPPRLSVLLNTVAKSLMDWLKKLIRIHIKVLFR